MSPRRICAIGAGVAGVAYGGLVLALAPTRQFVAGVRAVRSLGHNLNDAMDAIAAETDAHVEATATSMDLPNPRDGHLLGCTTRAIYGDEPDTLPLFYTEVCAEGCPHRTITLS